MPWTDFAHAALLLKAAAQQTFLKDIDEIVSELQSLQRHIQRNAKNYKTTPSSRSSSLLSPGATATATPTDAVSKEPLAAMGAGGPDGGNVDGGPVVVPAVRAPGSPAAVSGTPGAMGVIIIIIIIVVPII